MFGRKNQHERAPVARAKPRIALPTPEEWAHFSRAFMVDTAAGGLTGGGGLSYGAEPIAGAPGPTVQMAGFGAMDPTQLKPAFERFERFLVQLMGGADLHSPPTPAEVEAILVRVEEARAQGHVTDDQYFAVKAGARILGAT